jgi:DNA-binding NarL/FixJ family response regulator
MRLAIIDLVGDERWRVLASQRSASYVCLSESDFWVTRPDPQLIVVDGRNRYEAGLELIARLSAGSPPGSTRVLITERESAQEHERAYRAGTTRIALMTTGEQSHAAILADLLNGGGI